MPVFLKFLVWFSEKLVYLRPQSATEASACGPVYCENSSVGRARPCQGRGRGFESRFSLSVARMVEW